ncbi:hypothetical protein [Streptomyces sp. NPDC058255]|uniref:hypothetical protein n=1 Tax=Streptomyces sp. NPDC058255 TaxID=3346407 RepID=UPI0036DFB16A
MLKDSRKYLCVRDNQADHMRTLALRLSQICRNLIEHRNAQWHILVTVVFRFHDENPIRQLRPDVDSSIFLKPCPQLNGAMPLHEMLPQDLCQSAG